MKYWPMKGLLLAASLMLAACGGGSSLDGDTGGGGGGDTDTDPEVTHTISLDLVDQNGDLLDTVSATTPGVLRATLLQSGSPKSGQIISFEATVGSISPSLGTARTDASGVAYVNLLPGTTAGAGLATATFVLPSDEQSSSQTTISDTVSYSSAGDGEDQTGGSTNYSVSVTLSDSNVTAAAPVTATATVQNSAGEPVVQRVVSFETSLGYLNPASGTALTDANGQASVVLNAGNVQGAGEVKAVFQGTESAIGFFTAGDEIDEEELVVAIDAVLYSCPAGVNPPDALCTVTSNISSVSPGTLRIALTQQGSTVTLPNTLVNVTIADDTVARLSPSNGTVITDENGIAYIDVLAGAEVGATSYTITVQNQFTKTAAFQVGAADISLVTSLRTGNAALPAGGSTVVDIEVYQANGVDRYVEPLTLEISSACSTAGTAVLDNPVITVNGIATATYTAKGCVGSDPITITAVTGGRAVSDTINVTVAEASIASIQFVSVTENIIAVQQSGGQNRPTTTVATFKLLDSAGNPVAGKQIDFALNTKNGGVTVDPVVAYTDAQGLVETTVTSGFVSMPLRITASHSENGNLLAANVSSEVTITTGLADNNSFTVAVEYHNVEALNRVGETVSVTAYAADHFNNPVPAGTMVNFTTEGGKIGATCATDENGSCSVEWQGQNPIPLVNGSDGGFPSVVDFKNTISYVSAATSGLRCSDYYGNPGPCLDSEIMPDPCDSSLNNCGAGTITVGAQGGRSSILAYTLGEESFSDFNNNGLFDDGEQFVTLDDAYIDHNENGRYDGDPATAKAITDGLSIDGGELEESFDNPEVIDGVYTPADPTTATYRGTLCSEAAKGVGHCDVKTVHVRDTNLIVMSGSNAYTRLVRPVVVSASNPDGYEDCQFLDLTTGAGADSALLAISDINNNPMPYETRVTISAEGADLTSTSGVTMPSISGAGYVYMIPVSVKLPETIEGNGTVNVAITTPAGLITSIAIPVAVVAAPNADPQCN